MISQHSVEQTIYGAQARLRLAATVGRLRVSYRTENIPSYDVKDTDIRRAVMALTTVPAATLPESPFLAALGTPAVRSAPPQTGSLAQRAIEEWNETCVRTKQLQSWNRCRLENQPSSKRWRKDAHCHRA